MKFCEFDTVCTRSRLEKSFFGYCLRRQPGLIPYALLFFFVNLLRGARILKRRKYLEIRWSFTGRVRDLREKTEDFSEKFQKRCYFPQGVIPVSEQPLEIVKQICPENTEPLGNRFLLGRGEYLEYRTFEELMNCQTEGEVAVIEKYLFSKKPKGNFVFEYAFGKKIGLGAGGAAIRTVLYSLLFILLTAVSAVSICIGIAALKTGVYVNTQFDIVTVLRSALPSALLILTGYFLFGNYTAGSIVSLFAVIYLGLNNGFNGALFSAKIINALTPNAQMFDIRYLPWAAFFAALSIVLSVVFGRILSKNLSRGPFRFIMACAASVCAIATLFFFGG